MAREVAAVLADGGVLLAEAGTGTGKTLAYLVPAILSGHRVLVSTGTKNLQEQIYFKDLPALAETLPVKFKAAYMKGRANYVCLHRLDQARASMAEGLLDSIAGWAAGSETTAGSGRKSRPRRRHASAASVRSISSASSPACVSGRLKPTS
jgi:ATP-dependent DNA helicase DinG